MDSVDQDFDEAVKSFQRELDARQIELFRATPSIQMKRQILKIQHEQETEKRLTDFSRLRRFIDAFEEFDETCTSAQVAVPEISRYIWGPLTYILEKSKEDSAAFDHVLDSYEALGSHVPLTRQYLDLFENHIAMKKCLCLMYKDVLEFQLRLLKLFEQRTWRKTIKADWKEYNENESFKAKLQIFTQHGLSMNAIADSLRWREQERNHNEGPLRDIHRRMNDHVLDFRDYRNEFTTFAEESHHNSEQLLDKLELIRDRLLAEAEKDKLDRERRNMDGVREWLKSPAEKTEQALHTGFQESRRKSNVSGTWILSEKEIKRWINEDTYSANDPDSGSRSPSMLWLYGKRGSGKTVLTSRIIDHLDDECKDFKTSFFYCREVDQKNADSRILAILKSLIRQLLNHDRTQLPRVSERKSNCRGGVAALDNEMTAKSILDLFWDTSAKHFIVLDGLDELPTGMREQMLKHLHAAVQRSERYTLGRIRVLLVSRDLPDMRKFVELKGDIETYELNLTKVDKDIEAYLGHALQDVPHLELDETDRNRAIWLISERSQGMFVYTQLVMNYLRGQPDREAFQEALVSHTFPNDLREAYKKIIKVLQKNAGQWGRIKRIFGWLVCVRRPLRRHELRAALCIIIKDDGSAHISDKRRVNMDLAELCGYLIHEVVEGFEFIHQTVEQEIMEDEDLDRNVLELSVARSCLGYLSHTCFYHEATDESRRLFAKQGYYAFQDYAISYWESHVDRLVTILPVLVEDPVSGPERIVEATVILNKFFTVYESGISGESGPDEQHVSSAQLECQSLEQYTLHGSLVAIRAHVLDHQSRPTKDRNVVGIKTLGETLKKIRSIIIELSQDAASANMMEKYYGKTVFKCPRTLCAYFYEGFGDATFLKNHDNRHDRPFVCRSNQQCSSAPFGFTSGKDLDKHMRDYHPDHGEPFTSLQDQVQASGGSEAVDSSAGPRFRCDICPKRFTRSAALKAHKNGVHLGRRPYPCSICGREFTRKNDTMRHERTQHYRRR